MKKLLNVALAIGLSATALSASAQKKFSEGAMNYSISVNGQSNESKFFFKGDTSANSFQMGPATVRTIATGKGDYLAVVVDASQFGVKKAGIATPAELEETAGQLPKMTFTPTGETKVINGFNCKKVQAKDDKGNAFDVWVTNDIVVPMNSFSKAYESAGGIPVQFTAFVMGQSISATLKSVTEEKVPAGTFGIPAGFDRMTLTELRAALPQR